MSIEPDGKDWTWVLERPCRECGLTAADVEPAAVGELVRASLPRWRAALERPDVTQRPDPSTWSVLEYGCHVRDVFTIFRARLGLVLTHGGPDGEGARFENWDQDATAVEERYGEQDPAVVSAELSSAGEQLADAFSAVPDRAWDHVGLRSNGSAFTTATLAQYCWHDVAHHLVDVGA